VIEPGGSATRSFSYTPRRKNETFFHMRVGTVASCALFLLVACGSQDETSGPGGPSSAVGGSGGAEATGGGNSVMPGQGGTSANGGGTGGKAGSPDPGTGGASGGAGATGGTGGSNSGPTFHVFVLLGGSNMAGHPPAQAADRIEDERILVLGFDDCEPTGRKAGEWDVAAPPLHECSTDAVGPGDHFAKTLIAKLPEGDTIGLVPCALSDKSIDDFSKGTEKYDWIVERVKKAQERGGVVDGFLFHHGESDCGSETWPERVKKLVEDLKSDLGLGDIPFLPGELPYDGECSAQNALIKELPASIPNTHVVSAERLKVTDGQHFDHHSVIYLGERYEAALVEALGW
jgi:hypothetical protein